MAYFEITGVPLRPADPGFSPTVNLLLEKGRGLSIISDDGEIPSAIIRALTRRSNFVGEIFLNSRRIDPVPVRSRPIKVIGNGPGYNPNRTIRQNFESILSGTSFTDGEAIMLIERELSQGPLAGFGDEPSKSLDSNGRTILAATCALMSGCELLIISGLPVMNGKKEKFVTWRPGYQLDGLLDLKNLLKRFRATWISTLTDAACVQVLSDHLAIFSGGNLIQEGSLRECMNAPNSRLVADYLAFPKMNYRKCRVERDGPFFILHSGRFGFRVSDFIKRQLAHREGDELIMGVRPEDLNIRGYQTGDPTVLNLARVLRVDTLPGIQLAWLDVEGQDWVAICDPIQAVFSGQLIELRPDPERIHIFHPINNTSLLD